MFAALLLLPACSTNDAKCSQVTGGEISADMIARVFWDSYGAAPPVALQSESELDSFWEEHQENTFQTDPRSGAVDTASTDAPAWIDGTQIVLFAFNDFDDDGRTEVAKFAMAGDQLTVELLHVPFCPEGGPEYGTTEFQLFRTPALGDPLVCETATHCINY